MNKIVSNCCHAPVTLQKKVVAGNMNFWYVCSMCHSYCNSIKVSITDAPPPTPLSENQRFFQHLSRQKIKFN